MTRWIAGIPLAVLALGCGGDRNKGEDSRGGNGSSDDSGAASSDCPEDVEVFEERVWDPVLSTHAWLPQRDGIASSTRMVSILVTCSATFAPPPRSRLLLVKPTGLHDADGGGVLVESRL